MDKYPKYISQEQQERFELFLMDKMSVEEKRSFEISLTEDKNLQGVFEEFKSLFEMIEETGIRKKMNDFHTEVEKEEPTVSQLHASKSRFNYRIAASVAVLLTIGGLWFFNRPTTNEKLFDKYYTQDPGLPTVMGNSDNYAFYEAMVDYKQGNYPKAITKWEKLLAQKPGNDTLNYFLGVSYLAVDNMPKASNHLQAMIQDKNSVFKNEANIYLGLTLIRTGHIQNAKAVLAKSDSQKSREILLEIK